MSRKFAVGDLVRVVRHPERQDVIGAIATIVAGPVSHCTISGRVYSTFKENGLMVYEVDLPSNAIPGTNLGLPAEWLEIVYDGNEPVSWSTCAWQPHEVRA